MKKAILLLSISIFLISGCSSDDNSGSGEETVSQACQTLIDAVNDALVIYNNSTQAQSKTNCENYKKALESQKIVCGDKDGKIQELIDDLKDCSINT